MKLIAREPISAKALTVLSGRTNLVELAADPALKAKNLWRNRANKTFDEICTALCTMSSGRSRCMYCEDSAATDIEHFWPKAMYPYSAYLWPNYLWACSSCNSNFKRSQFPLDALGAPLLIDPTIDDPTEHLALSFRTGQFIALTPKGKASIEIFGLRREVLVQGRRDAWVVLQALLARYLNARNNYEAATAEELKRVIIASSFAGVLTFSLLAANLPGAEAVLGLDFVEMIENCPELAAWI